MALPVAEVVEAVHVSPKVSRYAQAFRDLVNLNNATPGYRYCILFRDTPMPTGRVFRIYQEGVLAPLYEGKYDHKTMKYVYFYFQLLHMNVPNLVAFLNHHGIPQGAELSPEESPGISDLSAEFTAEFEAEFGEFVGNAGA
jgi:hypothetical protein